jgi:aspartate/methionine/tyrosine aminotransferase
MKRSAFAHRCQAIPQSALEAAYWKCQSKPQIIDLNTSENRLMFDILLPIFRTRSEMTVDQLDYTGGFGTSQCRAAIADFYHDHLGIAAARPADILLGNGVSMLLERMAFAFCEPGDIVLVAAPGPAPPVLASGATIEFIDVAALPDRPPDRARILLLADPGVPGGDRLADGARIAAWAHQNPDLHVVVNESLALTDRSGRPRDSIVAGDSRRLHQVYGLSLDWGLAGLRVGFFYSKDSDVVKAVQAALGCCFTGSDTKWLTERILGDRPLRDGFVQILKERLQAAQKIVVEKCSAAGIECRIGEAGLTAMINLKHIAESADKEVEVAARLMDEFGVSIAPGGAAFRYPEIGWFGVCFGAEEDKLKEGLDRLVKGVGAIRAGK